MGAGSQTGLQEGVCGYRETLGEKLEKGGRSCVTDEPLGIALNHLEFVPSSGFIYFPVHLKAWEVMPQHLPPPPLPNCLC